MDAHLFYQAGNMKLRSAIVPDGVSEALHSGLKVALKRARNADLMTSHAGDEGGAALSVRIPHPVFHMQMEDLFSDHPLERANQVGVRYFVGDPGASATADVGIDEGGTVSGFQSLTRGPQANAMWEALDQAAVIDPEHEAEVRVLEVPSMYIAALWLATEMATDVFIPLESRAEVLEKLTAYPESEFLDRARSLAHRLQGDEDFPV